MSRNSHYFMWFILFGLIAGVVSFLSSRTISSEAIWLLGAGVLGWLFGRKELNDGGFARIFDFIIGVIFMLAGLIGIVYNFSPTTLPSSLSSSGVMAGSGQNAVLFGISLALFPAIVHLLLGFTSFRHGMENSAKK